MTDIEKSQNIIYLLVFLILLFIIIRFFKISNKKNDNLSFLTVYSSYPYKKIRIGKENDGGYIICDTYDTKLLISCGISNDISFEDEFTKKYNVKCHAFDGTIDNIPKTNNQNINWIKKNIGSINDDNNTNLKYLINNNNNILLKMDIESYEYDWLMSMTEKELLNINQIVIEFHFPFQDDRIKMKDKLECIKKLSKTHYIVHFHANNCCGTTNYMNTKVPNVFECTYLRKDYFKFPPSKNITPIPDPTLDSKNVLHNPEINLSEYPFVKS